MLTRRVKEVSLLKQNHAPKPSPVKCIKKHNKTRGWTLYNVHDEH